MFSSALRYRALGSVLRPRAIPYVTLAAADLRRLQMYVQSSLPLRSLMPDG